ncbi:MAG: adenosine deaminase [Candidatus Roizmanbacteria bacterium]
MDQDIEPGKHSFAELHFHVGQSVDPHVLWSLAHQQGIRLPSKDYHKFESMITLKEGITSWTHYHELFHWTELIQSSPIAIEQSIYHIISGAYRRHNITLLEPSFNPIFRNRGGERDLDNIILAALRGMEIALLEFPQVKAGIIIALDRRLPYHLNEILVQKAIRYHRRGIIGIDLGGPHKAGFDYKDYKNLYQLAQEAGLKTSVHTGEDGTPEEMKYVLNNLSLNRINHGIKATEDERILDEIKSKDLTLCICPSSNIRLEMVRSIDHFREIVQIFLKNNIKFCINTDSPAMFRTNLIKEFSFLLKHKILTYEQILESNINAFGATFINLPNKNDNLYL